MSASQDRSGWAWRGLVALGMAVTVMGAAGLAGLAFSMLETMPEGAERRLYTFGITAAAAAMAVLAIYGGSRLFLRGARNGGSDVGDGAAKPSADADGGETSGFRGFGIYGHILILVAVFNIYLDFMDRGGAYMQRLLTLDGLPIALMFALAVTPIMGILAVAERPDGARIKWRTVVFTAVLWPAALLADMIAPASSSFEGPARFVVAFFSLIVVVCWMALGAAIGTLDLMFSLSDPRKYEERLKGILPLAEGWRFWHGVPFLFLLLSMRWQNGWNGIPEIAGNPLFFAGVLAAATIALSRPRNGRGWAAACLAGAVAATLLLGGAAIAGRSIGLAGFEGPGAQLAAYLVLALPAIAIAVISIMKLSPPAGGSGEEIEPK